MNFPNQKSQAESLRELQPNPDFYSNPYYYMPRNDTFASNSNSGHWSDKQDAKYFAFLTRFKDKFSEKESRRQWKVFKSLAQFIKTRNPNQCRSHHHKMKKNSGSIEETLEFLKRKQPDIQKKSEKYLEQLKDVDFNDFGNSSNQQKSQNNIPYFQPYFQNQPWQLEPSKIDYHFGFDYPPCDAKVNDISKMKTNEDYKGLNLFENQPKQDQNLPDFSQPPPEIMAPSFGGFPTTGLFDRVQPKQNMIQNQNIFGSSNLLFDEPKVQGMGEMNRERANKVMQCHFYFKKWMCAMEQLLEIDESEHQR